METNLYGILIVSRGFAPVLKANGGGALINMLSALSWFSNRNSGPYIVTKAAAWALPMVCVMSCAIRARW
jgi:NAD(P)-dependent dehydrogenase (short-subunit alcohol dehydrogenase family)